MKKYYDILNVNSKSNHSEVKSAYKNEKAKILSNRYLHLEDKNTKLKTLKKAYLKIKNKTKQKKIFYFIDPFKFDFKNSNNMKLKKTHFYESKSSSSYHLQPNGNYKIEKNTYINNNGKEEKNNEKYIIDKFGKIIKF